MGRTPKLTIRLMHQIPTGLAGKAPFDYTWHRTTNIQHCTSYSWSLAAFVDQNSCFGEHCAYIKPLHEHCSCIFDPLCVWLVYWGQPFIFSAKLLVHNLPILCWAWEYVALQFYVLVLFFNRLRFSWGPFDNDVLLFLKNWCVLNRKVVVVLLLSVAFWNDLSVLWNNTEMRQIIREHGMDWSHHFIIEGWWYRPCVVYGLEW